LRESTRLIGGAQEPPHIRGAQHLALVMGDDALLSRRKNHRQRYCSFTFLYARPIRLSRCVLDFVRTKEEHKPSPVSTEQRYAPSFTVECEGG